MTEASDRQSAIEKATMRRVTLRIVPFLMLCYFVAFVDRVSAGFAALQMKGDLVVIDELVIGPLRPTPRGFIVFAWKDTHGGRDGEVGGVVKVDVTFPIEASRRNGRVRQPVEREVVEDVVAGKVACRVSIDRAPEYGRGDRRRRLAITVSVGTRTRTELTRRYV